MPKLPVIHPTVRKAWPNWCPRWVRAGAMAAWKIVGLTVATSSAKERMVSTGVPQISLAHSGVFGVPS